MKRILIITIITCAWGNAFSQGNTKISLNTGVGVVKVNPSLHHILKPAVAFNSELEISFNKKWFVQGTLDFNSLKYDQHVKDEGSELLFKNTSSTLLMLGINGGRNFNFNNNWFSSVYVGGGFLMLGEPRVTIQNNTVTQEIRRRNTGFGRTGFRVAKRTKGFFETVYVDASWWKTDVNVQRHNLNGFAFYLGTSMALGK